MVLSSTAPSLSKRHKPDLNGTMNGPPPDGSMPPGHGPMPPQQRYQQPPYGGGPPPMQQSGYMWQTGQYGGHPPPPHSWQGGQPPGPMYSQRGGPPMTPERGGGNWNGFRGPHPHQPPQASGKSQPRRAVKQNPKSNGKSTGGPPENGQMHQQQFGGWGAGNPQWGGHQWGNGPSQVPWQGGPPPQMHQPPVYGNQNGWAGSSSTPPRGGPSRPRASPEVMGNGMMGPRPYPPPNGALCQTVGVEGGPSNGVSEQDMYGSSHGVGMPMDDDGNTSSSGGKNIDKDKGRGSYKCGRCGVPKKGHVCPYQPKVKRRSCDPQPTMKGAAVQVEMDEFMTLRRLNIKIQGFPESYATDPNMCADMVGTETRPLPVSSSIPPRSAIMPINDATGHGPSDQPRASPLQSPLQGSPVPDGPGPIMGEVAPARS